MGKSDTESGEMGRSSLAFFGVKNRNGRTSPAGAAVVGRKWIRNAEFLW
jgi:hypothetical protein